MKIISKKFDIKWQSGFQNSKDVVKLGQDHIYILFWTLKHNFFRPLGALTVIDFAVDHDCSTLFIDASLMSWGRGEMDLPVYFVDSRNLITNPIQNNFHDFGTMCLPNFKYHFAALLILEIIWTLKIRSEIVKRIVLLNGNSEYLLSSVIKDLLDIYFN